MEGGGWKGDEACSGKPLACAKADYTFRTVKESGSPADHANGDWYGIQLPWSINQGREKENFERFCKYMLSITAAVSEARMVQFTVIYSPRQPPSCCSPVSDDGTKVTRA